MRYLHLPNHIKRRKNKPSIGQNISYIVMIREPPPINVRKRAASEQVLTSKFDIPSHTRDWTPIQCGRLDTARKYFLNHQGEPKKPKEHRHRLGDTPKPSRIEKSHNRNRDRDPRRPGRWVAELEYRKNKGLEKPEGTDHNAVVYAERAPSFAKVRIECDMRAMRQSNEEVRGWDRTKIKIIGVLTSRGTHGSDNCHDP